MPLPNPMAVDKPRSARPLLRVLHVLGELRPSGAETMFRLAAPRFAAEGIQAEIVSIGAQLGSYANRLADAGYVLHHVPFSKTPGFFVALHRVMRAGRYDVFHLHTEQAHLWIGLTALATRPKRVLQTIHNNFTFRGMLRLRRATGRLLLRKLGVVPVSISTSVRENERRQFGQETRLVRNWYDTEHFTPPSTLERRGAREALGIPDGRLVITTVGNCSSIKNHGALLHALALLPAESRPLYLHVGTEESDAPERRLAEKLGIADQVRFLGPLEDVRPVLYAADIYAMPSLYEGIGIAAMEALATGLPALFADVAGLRDFRTDFEQIAYANPDAESLCAALQELAGQDDTLRRARAKDYPSTSRRLFGIERGVAEYLEIYRGG